jgi:hypothetical protein
MFTHLCLEKVAEEARAEAVQLLMHSSASTTRARVRGWAEPYFSLHMLRPAGAWGQVHVS